MRSISKRPLLFDEAFVTSIVPYGEADCVVRLFLREQGRLVAFFKNGLANKKNKGSVSAPALARIAYSPREEESMARLVSCDLDPQSFLWASSLKLFAYGNYMAELIEKLLPEEELSLPIFELLEETFSAFAREGAKPSILRAFELKLLAHLGYLPEMPLSFLEPLFYDPLACHFSESNQTHSFVFNEEALALAHAMLERPVGEAISENHDHLMLIGRIFHGRLRLLNMLPLKSSAFFKQLPNVE